MDQFTGDMQGSPLLSEHEAPTPEDTKSSDKYEPSEDERKLVARINKLFEKAKRFRKKYDSKWLDYYKLFRGKQWKEERPAYRHSAVFNKIFRAIQSNVPIQTDARPKFEFLPTEPSDRELASILNELAQADWESKNWLLTLTEQLYDDNIYGTTHAGLFYDEEKYSSEGVGDICYESLDNFYSFPDPNCFDVNDKRCEFFIYAEPVDVGVLKREYPEKASAIKADLGEFFGADKTQISTDIMKSPTDNLAFIENSNDSMNIENEKALKITCWLYDDEVLEDEINKQLEDGTIATEKVKRKKYPKGRKVVITNKIVLEDVENEYEDGKIPVIKKQNYILPREYWGISEIENLEGPQVHYNKVMSFVLDCLHLMGNPIWVVDNTSGVDTDALYNRPGMVVEPNPNTRVQRVEGTQLQPYVLNLAQMIAGEFDQLAANEEVSRGVKPEGVTAAKAIEALQDTAQTRLRLKARVLDAFLQQFGQMWLSRTFQFRTVPQVYRYTNNQNVTKYFKFHVTDEPETDEMGMPVMDALGNQSMQKVVKYREVTQDPLNGQSVMGDEKTFSAQGKFDVRVGTGSTLPFAKTEKVTNAYQLFDRGIIDAEEVLKVVDWPNYEAVLERQRQAQMMQAQAQMAQQAPMPAAPGGDVAMDSAPMESTPAF